MRHRLDAEVLLDPAGQLDGAAAGGAAGAVCHRHEVGRVVSQHLERALERALALVGLGREELEGEDGAPLFEELGYLHGGTLTRLCQGCSISRPVAWAVRAPSWYWTSTWSFWPYDPNSPRKMAVQRPRPSFSFSRVRAKCNSSPTTLKSVPSCWGTPFTKTRYGG